MLRTAIVLLFMVLANVSLAQQNRDSLVSQTITYHTSKAGEMYIGWSLNNWKDIPDKSSWPPNTFLKEGLPYSKMKKNNDSFSITFSLPAKSDLNFLFWIPIDPRGDSADGWDTYGDQMYNSQFHENKSMNFTDLALWMPDKKEFDILDFGLEYMLIALSIGLLIIVQFRNRFSFSKNSFITGCLFASSCAVIVIRMQMNSLISSNHIRVPGAIFHDLLWLFIISAIFFLGSAILKKYK